MLGDRIAGGGAGAVSFLLGKAFGVIAGAV